MIKVDVTKPASVHYVKISENFSKSQKALHFFLVRDQTLSVLKTFSTLATLNKKIPKNPKL